MTRITDRLFISSAIFFTACMLQTAHAGQPAPTAPDLSAIQLPVVDHDTLVEELGTLRSQLIQHKRDLAQTVAERKPDGNDAFITAIMPGGLLYAGYKKARYEQAKDELARVSADIEELSGDLLAMQSMTAPVYVAQLP
jgi:hypothetical protein